MKATKLIINGEEQSLFHLRLVNLAITGNNSLEFKTPTDEDNFVPGAIIVARVTTPWGTYSINHPTLSNGITLSIYPGFGNSPISGFTGMYVGQLNGEHMVLDWSSYVYSED